jgi:hypothetical protein
LAYDRELVFSTNIRRAPTEINRKPGNVRHGRGTVAPRAAQTEHKVRRKCRCAVSRDATRSSIHACTSCGLSFARIQFRPDLMPADNTGGASSCVIRLMCRMKAPHSQVIFMLSLLARPNHAVKDFLYAVVQCLVSVGFQFLDSPGRGIWHPRIEWQSVAKHDLMEEHGDCIGGAQAHFPKRPGGPRFEFRLYPRRYEC